MFDFTLLDLVHLAWGVLYAAILLVILVLAVIFWPSKPTKSTLSHAPPPPHIFTGGPVQVARISLERRRVHHARQRDGTAAPPKDELALARPPRRQTDEQRLQEYFPIAFVDSSRAHHLEA
jgi:hypothetical protein